MEQGFPVAGADVDQTFMIVRYLLLAALAVATVIAVFATMSRAPTRREETFWIAGIGVFPFVAVLLYIALRFIGGPAVASPAGGWLATLGMFCCACCASGAWVISQKLKGQSEARFALNALSVLVFLLLGVALILPAMPDAGPYVRRFVCRDNLRQIFSAISEYQDEHSDRLPNTVAGDPPISWRVQLLPYLGKADLFARYNSSQRWNESPNDQVAREQISDYDCPSRRITIPAGKPWPTAYIIPTGPGALMQPTGKRQFKDANDGLSQTICLVEACGLEIPWTEPRDADISRQPIGVNLKGTGLTDSPGILSSWHGDVVNVGMADGSTRAISQNIDPGVLKALLTADGGETVPMD